MSEESLFPSNPPNRPKQTPARVLFLFVIAFAAVTIITVIQSGQRRYLEEMEARTAVGDQSYYMPPPASEWSRPMAVLESGGNRPTALYLQSDKPLDLEDAMMRKVAWPKERFYIYQIEGREKEWHVKVGEGKYLPLITAPPKPRPDD